VRDAIEYWSVVGVRAIATRLPDAMVRAWGSTLGLMFYALDRAHRRVALTNLEQCFPNRPRRAAGDRARHVQHFGQVLLKLLTFSALSPEQMLERAEYEGDERVRPRLRQGQGRAVSSPATSDSGNARRWPMRSSCGRSACWRDRSTTRAERSARAHAHLDRQSRDLSPGRGAPRVEDARGR
jgi:hypothetical protein